jgi:hypothetical protein
MEEFHKMTLFLTKLNIFQGESVVNLLDAIVPDDDKEYVVITIHFILIVLSIQSNDDFLSAN